MEYLEALKASKIGNGLAAPDHYTRLFAQKIGAERSVNKVIDWSPIVHVTDALAKPVVDLKIKINPVQSGKNNPSPDNVRPISGWTGCNIYRTGKNILDPGTVVQYYDIPASTTETSSRQGIKISLPQGTYTAHSADSTVNAYTYVTIVSSDGTFKERYALSTTQAGGWKTVTFTVDSGDFVYIYKASTAGPFTVDLTKLQIELGTFATDFEPYTGTTYPITFPSEAGTVYGGELDVTTGVLTVDRAMQIASECVSVSTASTGVRAARVRLNKTAKEATKFSDNISSSYKFIVSVPDNSGYFRVISNYLFIYDNRLTDKETADTILLAEQPMFVCELATPLTYQLTPTEVTTLLGVNNIWADTGDSYLVYKAKKTKG